MGTEVEATLKQRGEIYGKYEDGLEARAKIMGILADHHQNVNELPLSPAMKVAFHDLTMKIVRAAGKPDHTDSFHDLAGYATLIERTLDGK